MDTHPIILHDQVMSHTTPLHNPSLASLPENGQEQRRRGDVRRIRRVLSQRQGHLHVHGSLRLVYLTVTHRRSSSTFMDMNDRRRVLPHEPTMPVISRSDINFSNQHGTIN